MTHFIDTTLEPALWFLADWSLRWAALIGPVALVLLTLRPRRAALRQLMCVVALFGGLLLPLSPRWGSGWHSSPSAIATTPVPPAPDEQREIVPPRMRPIAAHAETKDTPPKRVTVGEPIPAANDNEVPADEPWGRRRIAVVGVALCWSSGVLLLLLRWGCGWWFLRRLRRGIVDMPGVVEDLFAACRAELGVRQRVRLAAHPLVRSPILMGLFRPLILVPLDFSRLSADVQRGGLLHELAHVRRRDHWLASLLHLLRVSFFFHPLVRWLLARLEYERELLCDEMVIQHGIERRDYARMLLEFARSSGRLALPGIFAASYVPMSKRRTIETRINHLLEDNMERWIRPLPTRWGVVGGTLLLALVLGLASYRVVAVEPQKIAVVEKDEKQPAAKKKEEKAKEIEKEQAARLKREALRYGGKNFDEWRTDMETELKATIRVDGMKAFAAFGANGYGPEATEAILEMMQGYDVTSNDSEDDILVVRAGDAAIRKIGAAAVTALAKAMKEENRNVRRFAILELGNVGKDARAALPALLAAMKNDDPVTRSLALQAVNKIDPQTKGFVAALIEAIKDEDAGIRALATTSIGSIGPKAKSAIPVLIEALRDKDTQVRENAMNALRRVGAKKEAVVAASRLLGDESRNTKYAAYEFLQQLGPDAEEAVPALIAALKETNADFQREAFNTLAEIGPAAKAAVPALEELLKSDNEQLRREAKNTLKQIRR